ncbi:BrnA antitoxin family protein [beta proteobacterium MWH-UniP1]
MRKDYDFSNAKSGPVVSGGGKTRLTIMLDNDVIAAFRSRAEKSGKGYQTLINDALRSVIDPKSAPVTEATVERVVLRAIRAAARSG